MTSTPTTRARASLLFDTLGAACAGDALYFGSRATSDGQTRLFEEEPSLESSAEAALMLELSLALLRRGDAGVVPPADSDRASDPEAIAAALRSAFVSWRASAEHRRHPGTTVLSAAGALSGDGPWHAASIPASKGSSPVARCVPFAFLPDDTWAGATQLQAAMTHAHPTVVVSAHVAAAALRWLAGGGGRSNMLAHLHELVQSEQQHFRSAWLGDVWRRGRAGSPSEWIGRGWRAIGDQLIALADELGSFLPEPAPIASSDRYLMADAAVMQTLRWWLGGPTRHPEDVAALACGREFGSTVAMLAAAFVGASGGGAGFSEVRFDLEARLALLRRPDDAGG